MYNCLIFLCYEYCIRTRFCLPVTFIMRESVWCDVLTHLNVVSNLHVKHGSLNIFFVSTFDSDKTCTNKSITT